MRNGYAKERRILTAAGAIEVKAPRVNDRRDDETTGELPAVHEFDHPAVVPQGGRPVTWCNSA